MNEDFYIGRHKECGGRVISWYQNGHYYYHSGIYCEKCHKEFERKDDGDIKPLIRLGKQERYVRIN